MKTFEQRGGFQIVNDQPRECDEIHAQIKSFMSVRHYPEGMQCQCCNQVFKPKGAPNEMG